MNITESIQFVLEAATKKGKIIGGVTGAAAGTGIAAGVNKLKQDEASKDIGKSIVSKISKIKHGDTVDRMKAAVGAVNPMGLYRGAKKVLGAADIQASLPKHGAIGAAAGAAAGIGAAYANRKLKDRNKLASKNKDLQLQLTKQADKNQLSNLQKQNQHGMQNNTSHY